ncbi:MAG: hypothetical protein HYZ28_16890 [Myxococcales bacterium]|nr:hypothetical protein [Myxococcales bacterium]
MAAAASAQPEPAAEAEKPAPAPEAEAKPADPAPSRPADPSPPENVLRPKRTQPSQEEIQSAIQRVRDLPIEQQAEAWQELSRRFGPGSAPERPVAPHAGESLSGNDLEMAGQVARAFLDHLLAGDARALVEHSDFPFQLEDRRVGTPEELFQEWLKHLRTKRTDLLALYGVEVLTPAEMEKKHGRPPARLQSMPWRGARTFLAVANLSGRPAVVLVKDTGQRGWRVVGYHD